MEYQKLMREIQHLTRLYVAWLFVCAEETKVKSAENLKVMQDNIATMQASMAENESKIRELSTQIQGLQKKKDQVHSNMQEHYDAFKKIAATHFLQICGLLCSCN